MQIRLDRCWLKSKPKVVRDIVLICVVLHNMPRTQQGRPDMAPTSTDDIATLQNEQVLYVPDDNYRNPLREDRHQQEIVKGYFYHHWLGRP